MKVLVASPTSTGIGGVARYVQGLTAFLESQGHHTEIISSANTFTIPVRRFKNPSFMISASIKGMFKRDFDIVHAQGAPAAFAMRHAGGKKILSLHGTHARQVEFLHGKAAGRIAEKYERFALNWADMIIACSEYLRDIYEKEGYDVRLIPNGIDLAGMPDAADRRHSRQIIYVGRLSREKGVHDVLRMAEGLSPDTHLVIVGDGPERSLVESCSLDNVHYLGPKPRSETLSLIRGSDILVQPSLDEGCTNYTLMESLACGTPVICTGVGGGRDFLRHMDNCYRVDAHDSGAMLEGIRTLYSDERLCQRLSKTGHDDVRQFSWDRIGPEHVVAYGELLG